MRQFNVTKGDLIKNALSGKYDVIAHGCNCFVTMGSGIAAAVHQFIPEAYRADCATHPGDINKLGSLTSAEHLTDNGVLFTIFNLYSQFTPNAEIKPLDYEALALSLRKMAFLLKGRKINKIGLPLIGFGLAGGQLQMIIPIMYRELYDFDVEVVVFEKDAHADVTLQQSQGLVKVLEANKAVTKYIESQRNKLDMFNKQKTNNVKEI